MADLSKLDKVDLMVIKACLKYARVGFQRSLAKATSENIAVALRKDIASVDAVMIKLDAVV